MTQTMDGARFSRKCAYLNSLYYDVQEPNGARYEAELRRGLSDYEASIYNGGAEAYRRECAPLVGVLQACDLEISPAVLAAFNAWSLAQHEASLAQLRADPARYGPESDWGPTVGGPVLARDAARYDAAARAWVFNGQAEAACA